MKDLLIPTSLIAARGAASRRWRRIVESAWACKSWQKALASEEFVDLNEVSLKIVIAEPCFRLAGNYVQAELVYSVFHDYFLDRRNETTSTEMKQKVVLEYADLILLGLDEFWFVLGYLHGPAPDERFWPHTYPNWGATILPKILVWWDTLLKLENRFVGPYEGAGTWKTTVNGWSRTPLACCVAMGLQDNSTIYKVWSMGPDKAFVWLSDFLKNFQAANPGK